MLCGFFGGYFDLNFNYFFVKCTLKDPKSFDHIFLGKKIYRVKAIIPVSPKKLIEALMDTEKLTEWNTTLTKHDILKVIKFYCKCLIAFLLLNRKRFFAF